MQIDPVELPTPPLSQRPQWSTTSTLICIVFGALAVFTAILAVRAIIGQRWFELFFCVLTAAVCVLPVYFSVLRSVDRDVPIFQEFVAEHGNGEFRVERDGKVTAAHLVIAGVVIIDAVFFMAGIWTGALHFDLSGRRGPALPWAAGIVALFALYSATAVAARGTSGWLRLSPTGIDHLENGTNRQRARWDQVREITMIPQAGKGQHSTPSPGRAWLTPRDTTRKHMSISLNWPMGNRATYWLIHFYLTHPELRDELGDDRVVERISAGRILHR